MTPPQRGERKGARDAATKTPFGIEGRGPQAGKSREGKRNEAERDAENSASRVSYQVGKISKYPVHDFARGRACQLIAGRVEETTERVSPPYPNYCSLKILSPVICAKFDYCPSLLS